MEIQEAKQRVQKAALSDLMRSKMRKRSVGLWHPWSTQPPHREMPLESMWDGSVKELAEAG